MIEQYEYLAEKEFLQWLGENYPFPYFWTRKYLELDIKVYFDEERAMPFVLHKDKRLYFPAHIALEHVREMYRALRIESDANSPHSYFTDSFRVMGGEVLFDVGAAEAWLTLENIDEIEHAYVIETAVEWQDALRATFEPYKDKVTILNKFASNCDDENSVRLDSIFDKSGYNVVIKLDVEGAEKVVIDGMMGILARNNVKIVLCTYHKEGDSEFFKGFFEDMGYNTQITDGYMLFPMPEWNQEHLFGKPSFRKGILRCWKQSEHEHLVVEQYSSLYKEEPLYKKIAILKEINGELESKNNEYLKINADIQNKLIEAERIGAEVQNKIIEAERIGAEMQARYLATYNLMQKQKRHRRRYRATSIVLAVICLTLMVYAFGY